MGFLDSNMGQTQLFFREVVSIRLFRVCLTEPGITGLKTQLLGLRRITRPRPSWAVV